MDDFIDLIVEFDKKFLKLLKHIVLKPEIVLQSLSKSESQYVKPFRFYSYISSLVILIVVLLNRFDIAGFWSESFFLPSYWERYYQSANQVSLILFPFLGLYFIIIIASFLSFLMFRKLKLYFKYQVFFTLYQSGTLLLYYLVALTLILVLDNYLDLVWVDSLFMGFIYLLFIIIPGLFVIRSQWSLGGIKWLRPVKSIIIIILTGFIFSSFYFDLELDRIINNEFFYRNAKEEPLSLEKVPIIRKVKYESQENDFLFPVNTHTDSAFYLYGIWNGEKSQIDIRLLSDSLPHINNLNEKTHWNWHDISLYHFNNRFFAITHIHLDKGSINKLWSISKETVKLIDEDSLRISTLSSIISKNDSVLISGKNQQKHAALYYILSDTLELFMQFKKPESNIDFMILTNPNTLFTVNSTVENKKMSSIFVNKINLNQKEVEKSIQLFENRIANVPAYHEWNSANRKIYNPWIGISEDSSAIYVSYQLMTEKTFELQLFKLDSNLNLIDKNSYNPPGNLSYFHAHTIYQDTIYAFGRRLLLVPSSPFGKQFSYSFLTKFSANDLKPIETIYLEESNAFFDVRYELFMSDAKLNVDKDSIYILWSNGDQIEELRIKK